MKEAFDLMSLKQILSTSGANKLPPFHLWWKETMLNQKKVSDILWGISQRFCEFHYGIQQMSIIKSQKFKYLKNQTLILLQMKKRFIIHQGLLYGENRCGRSNFKKPSSSIWEKPIKSLQGFERLNRING